jgi:hypothetical protein
MRRCALAEDIDNVQTEAVAVNSYDIDIDKLEKGQVISVGEVERLTGVSFHHRRFALELLQLRDFIVMERMRIGRPLSVRSANGSLVINTDAQASQYHHQLAMSKIRGFIRQTAYLAAFVDPTKLTDDERREHDTRLTCLGVRKSALVRIDQSRTAEGPSGQGLVHTV